MVTEFGDDGLEVLRYSLCEERRLERVGSVRCSNCGVAQQRRKADIQKMDL